MAKKGDPRVSIKWQKLRKHLLAQDDTCHICHHPGADTLDHLIPLAAGGEPYDPDNLAPAHRVCNSRKNAKTTRFFDRRPTPALPGRESVIFRGSPWSN